MYSAGYQRVGERGVLSQVTHHRDHIWVFQKNQFAVAVVVGERAERFGTQGDLRVQLARRVECDWHGVAS